MLVRLRLAQDTPADMVTGTPGMNGVGVLELVKLIEGVTDCETLGVGGTERDTDADGDVLGEAITERVTDGETVLDTVIDAVIDAERLTDAVVDAEIVMDRLTDGETVTLDELDGVIVRVAVVVVVGSRKPLYRW